MRAPPTRDRILKVAHDLFYKEGFHAVGLDRILREVGVTKTTFYNHFASKDDLIAAALDQHDKWWRDTFCALLQKHGGDKPRDQLRNLFNALDEIFQSEGYNGCFFVNVAVQFPNPNDPAHIAAQRHKQAMEAIIRERAGFAGANDPAAFAQEYCLLMEGAYVTAQITKSAPTAAVAKRMAEMLIERHMPG